ncbi:interleukin-27 subunit beta [Perognathus longimembris pacificus]|uniref:interleukin-27 subunit beta n=1 Tax=Perognathus longimembris pacificus TaxID=214514 RepID=UPI0020186DE4|nr:interleukin-27 subunit beta [Perognathus longimembris pacificus]
MTSRLLLVLTLWAGCLSPSGGQGTPEAVSQLRVQCRASRYPVAVDCSWTLSPTSNATGPTSFIATYRLGVAAPGDSRPCLQPAPEAPRCSVPEVRLFSMVPHVLNVTVLRPGGTACRLLPFVPERLIKPDPPAGVHLSHVSRQRWQVQWQPPRSWPFPEVFSLKYWIRYKRCGASRFHQVGPIEATTFTLRSVRPHARYVIQVSAQDLTDYGEPSDWSLPAATPMTLGK